MWAARPADHGVIHRSHISEGRSLLCTYLDLPLGRTGLRMAQSTREEGTGGAEKGKFGRMSRKFDSSGTISLPG